MKVNIGNSFLSQLKISTIPQFKIFIQDYSILTLEIKNLKLKSDFKKKEKQHFSCMIWDIKIKHDFNVNGKIKIKLETTFNFCKNGNGSLLNKKNLLFSLLILILALISIFLSFKICIQNLFGI